MTSGKKDDRSGPPILDLPIGLDTSGTRTETDSIGEIQVPADHYWGAQTQRSLIHFNIGDDRMPKAVYHAYGYIKKAAAIVNAASGRLPRWKAELIGRVADEVIRGDLDTEFPLYVWQTGSGTQSNMNVNEVISNRALQLIGGRLGSKDPIHPNDHVNMGQSSNDTFVTAMHMAAVLAIETRLLPASARLREAAEAKSREWEHVVKIGRTHLEDATPLTVGQEWSGYVAQLADAIDHLSGTLPGLYRLAIGGTAVGTGLNAPPGFGDEVAARIADLTGRPFVSAANKFAAQASCDALVRTSAAVRALAVPLFKFANDMRWLGSGPRAGLHELILPSNEPGSSIMPGKVNPTQAEAMLMVAIQVIGNDTAVSMAGAEGNFELNAFRPIIINNVLHSVRILSDMIDHFRTYLVEGVRLDTAKLKDDLDRSIMMVTALSPVVGYDKAARIAHRALDEDLTLRDAALKSGVSEDLYGQVVVPERLTRPGVAGVRPDRQP
ncbi:class II fumarate hydratase [Microtetraspora sp. NBRC 16547]|uniref:class II fumarate hydratase n=1 Tax=Microtetraspora sp. NBRC 16547 TaxID=3030993 RepID=UPI0024A16A5D|nr:class II fumarate hydratase [Microtetraspora sp. NBRC 16547]GLW96778.1 class II fumarate hydratase [Microtetraspora sp. NBRC 16547]